MSGVDFVMPCFQTIVKFSVVKRTPFWHILTHPFDTCLCGIDGFPYTCLLNNIFRVYENSSGQFSSNNTSEAQEIHRGIGIGGFPF